MDNHPNSLAGAANTVAHDNNSTQSSEYYDNQKQQLDLELAMLNEFSTLRLHQSLRLDGRTIVIRVPGGWIYETASLFKEPDSNPPSFHFSTSTSFVSEGDASSYYSTAESEIKTEMLLIENERNRAKLHSTQQTMASQPQNSTMFNPNVSGFEPTQPQ